ncbi:MAG: M50 family metallopeptidase [Gammaproteobacteria bacterium]|nr:M50 family metallopeptidase [Gammaproteobacteria bacterium]
MKQCSQCGHSSKIFKMMVAHLPNNESSKATAILCPGCYEKKELCKSRSDLIWLVGFALLGMSLINLFPHMASGWVIGNIVLLYFISALSLVLHEFAHYAMMLILKGTVAKVQLGIGPLITKINLFNTTWEFRFFWVLGLTFVGFKKPHYRHFKILLIFIAGPLVNLLLALVSLGALLYSYADVNVTETFCFWLMLFITNSLMFLAAMNPRASSDPQAYPSDGRNIWLHLSGQEVFGAEEYQIGYYQQAIFLLMEESRYQECLELCQEACEQHPEVTQFKAFESTVLPEVGFYQEAVSLAQQELAKDFDEENFQSLYERSLFYAALGSGLLGEVTEKNLVRAEEAVDESLSLLHWNPSVIVLKADIARRQHQYSRALSLAKEANDFLLYPVVQAALYALLALCYLAMDDLPKAQKYRKRCLVLNQADRLIEEMELAFK